MLTELEDQDIFLSPAFPRGVIGSSSSYLTSSNFQSEGGNHRTAERKDSQMEMLLPVAQDSRS